MLKTCSCLVLSKASQFSIRHQHMICSSCCNGTLAGFQRIFGLFPMISWIDPTWIDHQVYICRKGLYMYIFIQNIQISIHDYINYSKKMYNRSIWHKSGVRIPSKVRRSCHLLVSDHTSTNSLVLKIKF